ncbi:MAG: GTPase ObgE [Candidatus Pacebacteria bacterium]|nr:GTPase ObgE [Candidatus Paceibacterota bacterium]
MFVDELEITAKAGNGGDGVVRWRREKFKPMGGPAGGNGGRGGDVYIRAVHDLSILSKYTGSKAFAAEDGEAGRNQSQHGHDGADCYIDVPVGATVRDIARDRTYTLDTVGATEKILLGGHGGLGNEYFKSSTNRAPEKATPGKQGESGAFMIELALLVDVGLIGLPNAGKSTLLNTLTNAKAAVGAYPFTTLEPHLGDLYGVLLADIPGLIEGASDGKGLGHKFLRHVTRTKMVLHCVSLENQDPVAVYTAVREELVAYDKSLAKKPEWIVLTKTDINTDETVVQQLIDTFAAHAARVFVVSAHTGEGIKTLSDALTKHISSENESE